MNFPKKTEQEEKPKRQLYACLDEDSGKTFFASFIDRRGLYIELRSSWIASRGKSLILFPVPESWDGKDYSPVQIKEAPNAFEAHVSRAESRGQFQIRLLSDDQQDLVHQLQMGVRKDLLSIEQSHVGKIDIIKLSGRVSVESMGRIQSALRTENGIIRLVILDLRDLVTIPSNCLGVLHTILKEEMANGLAFNFLVKPDSRVESEINESRVLDLAAAHDEYETAVAHLLQSILD